MTYNETIDEKYSIEVNENGRVKINRYGENWLENPEGAKAWIAVADLLETQRELFDSEGSPLTVDQLNETASMIAHRLTEAWGWLPDEEEAHQIGRQLAAIIHLAVKGTRTAPSTMIQALVKGPCWGDH